MIDVKWKKELVFNDEQFKKLTSNTNQDLMNIFYEFDEYVMTLNDNIKKGITSVYLAYNVGKNFIELWFQVSSLKFVIMADEYEDNFKAML